MSGVRTANDVNEAAVDGVGRGVEAGGGFEGGNDELSCARKESECRRNDSSGSSSSGQGYGPMCSEDASGLDSKGSSCRNVGELVFLDGLSLVGDGESLAANDEIRDPQPFIKLDIYLQSIKVSSVVENELSGRDEGGRMDGFVGINQASTSLSEGLERFAIGETRRDFGSGGFKEVASALGNTSALTSTLEKESRYTSEERSGHGSSRQDGITGTEREGVCREDVTSRTSYGRLEVEVV